MVLYVMHHAAAHTIKPDSVTELNFC